MYVHVLPVFLSTIADKKGRGLRTKTRTTTTLNLPKIDIMRFVSATCTRGSENRTRENIVPPESVDTKINEQGDSVGRKKTHVQ